MMYYSETFISSRKKLTYFYTFVLLSTKECNFKKLLK